MTGRVREYDDGYRDCVCRVRADGIGGQHGDYVLSNERWGSGAVHHYCTWPGVQVNGRACALGRAYQRRLGPQTCRGSTLNPEGMGLLRAIQDENP